MNTPSYGGRDPIYALATARGESALALIRTSGGSPEDKAQSAIDLVARVFSLPEKLLDARSNSVVHGWIVAPQPQMSDDGVYGSARAKIDEVLVSVYRAPRSYTGEDGADISCHGGIATVKAVMAALKAAGFREALPGEFTFRAFMNGKLDLTQAESVMELVAAKTHKGREQAVRRLAGVLQKEISAIKEMLVEVLAGTEIYLDYSEDEFLGTGSGGADTSAAVLTSDEEAGRLPERRRAEQALERLKSIARLWQKERLYADGVLAVIAGKPNAGKSSLFNYLLREDRSIVTDVPGTTRDWIEALVSVEGIPLRLADTAGLRDIEQGDEVERIGIKRSRELLDSSGLILYVINGGEGLTKEDREFFENYPDNFKAKPLIIIWNKADIAPPSIEAKLPEQILSVSAKTGQGIEALLSRIACLLETESSHALHLGADRNDYSQEAAGPGTLRQKDLIESAVASVEEALTLADREEPLDIIAPLFRSAVNALGEITGEVTSEDIFNAMFSRFCVGK
ncbi:MAG: tRNA uridine-5-carboxymethylaminomethyl(34) synthesis GTPase MnmE [Treponema sp.]|jgi:tRNA modification GTPase|nr:tRNA uridine-5-carboxymethylaminomethyl(34) synthesis GTPase MnmE [Treponema sp.]